MKGPIHRGALTAAEDALSGRAFCLVSGLYKAKKNWKRMLTSGYVLALALDIS
jgi:hypothetical protein